MPTSRSGHCSTQGAPVEISIVVPTRGGGALLSQLVGAALAQRTSRAVEVLLIDSGSEPGELEKLRESGARVVSISPDEFDHGATRDFGAAQALGSILVFVNQDCLPVGEDWLEGLIAPLLHEDPPAAVQGAIAEFPRAMLREQGRRRFYWDSGGDRFNFTRESRDWIERHGAIGFSTVHCALRRPVWESLPFGRAPILEDKKWQRTAFDQGHRIVAVGSDQALVWHSHDYDMRSLLRRSISEGLGWRLVGAHYSVLSAFLDCWNATTWRDWWTGLRAGELRRPAEVLFPIARPLGLWWGNRWARAVRL